MRVTFWGTRGSLASPGPETAHYGGNTSCVEVRGREGTILALDAGTGIRRLGASLPADLRRVDVLLTHLHLDHIQGLGFFAPLYNPATEVHIWGPAGRSKNLRAQLMRYLSPPLFPVHLRDLPNPKRLVFREAPNTDFDIGEFHISASHVTHPGPTVGYRIATPRAALAYIPDHEPMLGRRAFPTEKEWTSGYAIAEGVDLLIHDAQFSNAEYESHIGWGHSSLEHALAFSALAGVKRLSLFHHDPDHNDAEIDRLTAEAVAATKPTFPVMPAAEGDTLEWDPVEEGHR